MFWFLLLSSLFLLHQQDCNGFSHVQFRRTYSRLYLAKRLSYEEMLQQAKLMKENGNNNPRVKSATPVTAPRASIEKKSAPSTKRSTDGLPFSDEMYSHLKYAIEKISGRMKNETPLTKEEIEKLKESVDAIIADSKYELDNAIDEEDDIDDISHNILQTKLLVPLDDDDDDDNNNDSNNYSNNDNTMYSEDPEEIGSMTMRAREEENNRIRQSKPEYDSSKDPFGEVRGKYKSLWGFDKDEIENISTDEYYSKVNKRISEMKQRRRELGEYDPEISQSYEKQLNNMNRKPNH